MNILHVAHSYYPCLAAGGVVNASYQIGCKQVQNGNEVYVYTTDSCKERLKFDKTNYNVDINGIKVNYFKNLSNTIKTKTLVDTPITAAHYIRKDISNHDIIHIHEHRQTLAILTCHYARKNNIPYIVQAHGSVLPFFQKEKLKEIYDKFWGFNTLHNANKVFALTEIEKQQYIKMGVSPEKIEIVPLGINLEEYSKLPPKGEFRKKHNIQEEDTLLIFIGRLHKIKGLDLLIEAFDELIKTNKNDNIKLAIIGPDDGFLPEIQKLLKKKGLNKQIIITGPLYKQEKQEALTDCDMFIMPSQYESFTTSGLEAMACEKPLILTKNNHIHNWVNQKCGLSCDYDKISLKNSIQELIENEQLAKQYGKEGRKLVEEKYNWNVIDKQIINIYNSIIK
ncbi:MAG: glycosyltransferase [Methanobacteriaceae archaeon]|jgi:glycosyltransferase involved in cell wall biosynthesis|nr:glycosyltransferase [Methanobacteriaceae archaeon]